MRFVDNNTQPNGRSADSASATHYLLPKIHTIQTPKKGVCNYEARGTAQSLVGEFNCVQENNRQTISNYPGSVWLKRERPEDRRQLESEVATLHGNTQRAGTKSHEYYTEVTAKCNQTWKETTDLEGKDERTHDEEDNLAHLKHCYTAVLSANYQMSRLVPSISTAWFNIF